MRLRMIVFAVGLAVTFSPARGEAEVLSVDSTFVINGMPTISDPSVASGDIEVASQAPSGDFEVQSAPIASGDTFDLDRATLGVTAASELPNWVTTLLSLTGFGR
jgi:hypothetical protein